MAGRSSRICSFLTRYLLGNVKRLLDANGTVWTVMGKDAVMFSRWLINGQFLRSGIESEHLARQAQTLYKGMDF